MNEMDPLAGFVPKFGVGQSVTRKEDPRLLRGDGRYTDDFLPEGQLTALFVRSSHAHAVLEKLDVEAARAAPGVVMVLTTAELDAKGYPDLPCGLPFKSADGSPMIVPPHPSLARDRVRYVGQPYAVVIALTMAAARDAAERIEAEFSPLPVLVELERARDADAPLLHEEAPQNTALDFAFGDEAAVEAAFQRAAHVTRLKIVNNRVMVVPMEPRGAVVDYRDGRWTVRTGCQNVFGLRASLAGLVEAPVEQVRVLADDIGGSFGMKASVFPEHLPLMHAARELGRPIKWVNDRSESFTTDYHGRDSVFDAELALDDEGNFLAVRVEGLGSAGAYVAGFGPAIPTGVIQKNLPSLYKTPLMSVRVKLVLTNTTPMTAYRGAGRPEAVYMMERLVEQAARETGRDPLELRRQNFVPSSAMPFTMASGVVCDSGDFAAVLDQGLEVADAAGFAARRQASEARGLKRGLGYCTYAEVTAPQGKEMGGIRFAPDGRITLVTGTLDYGQGHASAFAQVLATRLGLPFDRIDLLQGDSDELLYGGGTGGSRSLMASGEAVLEAADQVVEKGMKLASEHLEAAEADIVFEAGSFRVAGTDRRVTLAQLGIDAKGALDVELVTDTPPSTCPNGCHVAEVEVDPETGRITLVGYSAVDDFGTLVNPLLVEGQVHGGVVQAIGQALTEHVVYDASGQLLTGSFMDYALPRADDLPDFKLAFHTVPATTNRLGAKGCGEAGITAALAAVVHAVLDALAPYGITHLDMPLTPERVWSAIRAAG
jgi:carbon-monoxide dehydrogenase large subunit